MRYRVNDTWLSYDAVGERAYGDEHVLLDHAVDLSQGTAWTDDGFTVETLYPRSVFDAFYKETRRLLISCWRAAGLAVPDDFTLDQYHRCAADLPEHLAAIEKTRLLPTTSFPLGIALAEERISEICGVKLQAYNPFDSQSVFHFRVIRPQRTDNNPLHRDVWLEDYDDCINLYIPIAGSNSLSSLIILPGSHRWPESKIERTVGGCEINKSRFNVPAVTGIRGEYTVVRPDPKENEVLVFSPYLIHGGAVNLNLDQTRISIELRLWKAGHTP